MVYFKILALIITLIQKKTKQSYKCFKTKTNFQIKLVVFLSNVSANDACGGDGGNVDVGDVSQRVRNLQISSPVVALEPVEDGSAGYLVAVRQT